MLLRSHLKVCLFFLGALWVQSSYAAVDIGFDYHFNLTSDNNGMKKNTVNDASIKRTNMFALGAEQKFSGTMNDTSYMVDLDLLFAGNMAVVMPHLVYGTQKLTDMISVSFGQRYLYVGGWEAESGVKSHLLSNYLMQATLPKAAPLVEAQLMLADIGTFSLQLLNDMSSNKAPAFVSKNEAVAVNLQWKGSFGPVMPLIQANIYDEYKSLGLAFGLKFKHEMCELSASYIMDTQKRKVKVDTTERESYKLTNLVVDGMFHVASFAPFFKVAQFDNVQAKDVKVNGETDMSDNSLEIEVGSEYAVSKSFNPYISVGYDKGQFAKPVTGEKQGRSNMKFMVGVVGTI